MKFMRRLRGSPWVPAAIVFVVVLAAGARLIDLSVRAHAAEARQRAAALATRDAQAVARQLQSLVAAAGSGPRASPGSPPEHAPAPRPRENIQPRVFDWHPGAGPISGAGADAAAARAIATEWIAEGGAAAARSGFIIGPLREGSEWLIAAVAPAGRAAFTSLDQILAATKLGSLAAAGYDFALIERNRAGEPGRTFVASRTEQLGPAAEATIAAPAGFEFLSGRPLTLEVRPRAGWYPTRTLATDIGLLALTTWLLTFIAHDLAQRTRRLRAALESSRRQLRAANERLVREIEQRHELEESVDRARFHDPFTGLPNRRCFMDQLDRALRDARIGRGPRVAVFLVDIERFQLINETLGHTAGDELMVQAARRFEQTAGSSIGILARWGGDQFALLARGLETTDAAMGLARSLHETLREPFELRRHRLAITARIGTTCVATGPQRAEDVVREADIALSVAKRTEDSLSVAYTPSMGGDAASLVSLEADLHVALERRELTLLFQPIVDLRGPRAVGAEALLRWRHPVEGLLRPDRFLPIAEEAGLMVPITRWAVRRVCRLAGEWRRRLPPDAHFYLTVNLSAAVLRDAELADYVQALLEETATAPETLKFELTEGGLISNVGGARNALERLRRTGVQLMLDDFGTGYSSLNHLQLFPFDYVKIDRPIAGEASGRGASLASAMVQLASSLGLTPIAEVVESQATADALEEMGCHFGQGNFFCAPVEPEEALACLRRGTPEAAVGAASGAEKEGFGDWVDDSPTLMLPADFLSGDSAEA